MAYDFPALEKSLRAAFGEAILDWTAFRDQPCVHVKRDKLRDVLKFLRNDESTKFDLFTDVTALDLLKLPPEMEKSYHEHDRFAVVYHLSKLVGSTLESATIRVKTYIPEEPPICDTASDIWLGANWGEREVYDMFGIKFRGHPDLKRILCPDNLEGHALRKDYPLKGRGERDNFPKYTDIPEYTS